jgi:SAM-dependent methyltransferase
MESGASRLGIPWWAKIGSKLILSRLPIDYRLWSRLGLFKHGSMADTGYAIDVFLNHYRRCWPSPLAAGYTCLEIGPGDTLFSALVARSQGAGRVVLVDADHFADDEPEPYRALARELSAQGLPCPHLDDAGSLGDVLVACNATYITRGLAGLKALDTASVDFVWSQAVLEHIRKAEFLPYMRELRRVMKPDGRASHRVDLRDHLGAALNNLRFSETLWEKDWFARSGFYTNRIRYSQMCELFREAGFRFEVLSVDRWHALPTPRSSLAEPYRAMDDDELRVSGFDVRLSHGEATQ